jgi:CheY-like chemotaxis protein
MKEMKGKGRKIFVADDDEDILQIVCMMLETEGYEVAISTNAKIIFDYTEQELPDVILLDIWMSGVDGREICAQLKKDPSTKDIPVLFISANSNIFDITKKCKADGFIAKPFEMEDLLEKVGEFALQNTK